MKVKAKKLVNNEEEVVADMLDGFVLTNPNVCRLSGYDVIVRKDFEEMKLRQPALISGGGSGHEPAHAGFVGDGMLTAAVCGGVFASPSVESILVTICTVTGPKGCLLIVKNYTGDRLNFGVAAEEAKALGYNVEIVFVADDYALDPKQHKGVTGRRGLAGTIFVHKAAGVAAKAGCSLADVTATAQRVADSCATFGVSLSVCNIPGNDISNRLLPTDGKMELGLGIHGEAGLETVDIMKVEELLPRMMKHIAEKWEKMPSRIVAMINNLGGTTAMEMFVIAKEAAKVLASQPYSCTIERMYIAPFMTSLEMAGFSLTLLAVDEDNKDILLALDEETNAPGWPAHPLKGIIGEVATCPAAKLASVPSQDESESASKPSPEFIGMLVGRIRCAAEHLIENEDKLAEWDTIVGDGDCGETFRRAAEYVLETVNKREADGGYLSLFNSPQTIFAEMGRIGRKIGGSSGAVLAIFFRACQTCYVENFLQHSFEMCSNDWQQIIHSGNSAITKYGRAKKGMRTMLDALCGLEDGLGLLNENKFDQTALNTLLEHTMQAACATAEMKAKAGRSSYLSDSVTKHVPDPGAMAVAFAIQGLLQAPNEN